MLALVQRVTAAMVQVDHQTIGSIQKGIVSLIGIEKKDNESSALKLIEKILNYRIFEDAQEKMNLSLKDIKGGLLLVSQFTLVADTASGTRPGFSKAMSPDQSKPLFEFMVRHAQEIYSPIASGKFGAYMQVSLCNDGPATFLLQV